MVVVLVLFLVLLRIVNSPLGRVLQAIRENDFRAESLGFRTVNTRWCAGLPPHPDASPDASARHLHVGLDLRAISVAHQRAHLQQGWPGGFRRSSGRARVTGTAS